MEEGSLRFPTGGALRWCLAVGATHSVFNVNCPQLPLALAAGSKGGMRSGSKLAFSKTGSSDLMSSVLFRCEPAQDDFPPVRQGCPLRGHSCDHGGVASPSTLRPQQATVRSVLTPQVCALPAVTEVNVSAGGEACPSELSPQQTMVPLAVSAQAWE
jgi:hypothetical protein